MGLTDTAVHVITGGGAIQLIMPQIYDGLLKHHPSFIAWRWAFFVPGSLHIIVASLVLFAATVRYPRVTTYPAEQSFEFCPNTQKSLPS